MVRFARLAAIVLLVLAPRIAAGQQERYELGRRLRAFEAAWDQYDTPGAHQRALKPLKEAVGHFFGFRLGEAGRALTMARLALCSENPPSADKLWAESLYVKPESRLIDVKNKKLLITVDRFYPVDVQHPLTARLRVRLILERLEPVTVKEVEFEIAKLPVAGHLAIEDLDGDYRLEACVFVGNEVAARSNQTLSVVKRLSERLDALRISVAGWPEAPATADRETCKSLLRLLDSLAKKNVPETDFPAAVLLNEVEDVAEAVVKGKARFEWCCGRFWLTLPVAGKLAPMRVMVPPFAPGERFPLVIALHGAGGSENMFFDAYGNGLIEKLCLERNWILVATRNGGPTPLADLVDELAKRFPIDKKRVFLVGHSMGAAQSVAAVNQTPERFTAVAALGGGGLVREAKGLENIPFFVGVGAEDFALRNARSLADTLKKKGIRHVELREYSNTEHLTIVQVALKDVFAFFDDTLKRNAESR